MIPPTFLRCAFKPLPRPYRHPPPIRSKAWLGYVAFLGLAAVVIARCSP